MDLDSFSTGTFINVIEFCHNTQALRVVDSFCRAPVRGNCHRKRDAQSTGVNVLEENIIPLPKWSRKNCIFYLATTSSLHIERILVVNGSLWSRPLVHNMHFQGNTDCPSMLLCNYIAHVSCFQSQLCKCIYMISLTTMPVMCPLAAYGVNMRQSHHSI